MRRKSQELRTTIELSRAIVAHCALVVALTSASSSHWLNTRTAASRAGRSGGGARVEPAAISAKAASNPSSKTTANQMVLRNKIPPAGTVISSGHSPSGRSEPAWVTSTIDHARVPPPASAVRPKPPRILARNDGLPPRGAQQRNDRHRGDLGAAEAQAWPLDRQRGTAN